MANVDLLAELWQLVLPLAVEAGYICADDVSQFREALEGDDAERAISEFVSNIRGQLEC